MKRFSNLLTRHKDESKATADHHKRHLGDSLHKMMHLEPSSEHVYRFSAGSNRALNSEVYNHDGQAVYRFATEGKHMTMYDVANGREIASVAWSSTSRVTWEGVETKLTKFVFMNSGNTGQLFTHDGNLYEWLQDVFHATIRTTPGAVRMAVIYNDKEKPEVELTPEGLAAGSGFLEKTLFLTALFECGLWKNPGFLPGEPKLKKILAAAGSEHAHRPKSPSLIAETQA